MSSYGPNLIGGFCCHLLSRERREGREMLSYRENRRLRYKYIKLKHMYMKAIHLLKLHSDHSDLNIVFESHSPSN